MRARAPRGWKHMEIAVGRCLPEDLFRLRELSERLFFETYSGKCSPDDLNEYISKAFSTEKIREELSCPYSGFWFIYADGALSGYLKLNEAPAQNDINDPDSLEIERVYVDGKMRGKGLGAALIRHACETALKRGKKYVWLSVWERNTGATGFYENQGFERSGARPYLLGSDRQTDYIMKKSIRKEERP